ncbi:MAG: hypothetical protein ACLQBK_23835 [Candidatus Sulfotelmatobacter sp.]
MQLGLENKKKTMWAAALGVLAVLAVAYEVIPMLTGPSSPESSAQAAAPVPRVTARPAKKVGKLGKKERAESLDPTLRLELLAASEKTQYQGSGRNIFVSQAEEVVIPPVGASPVTDPQKAQEEAKYQGPPPIQAPPPIPLQFYGFASRAGEAKKIFLKLGDDVWVAGEGEIVDRRYKVIRITPTSVEIQDVVNSGPPQSIPLTQG